ncbi:MAG: hypothetical protein HQK89_14530, partial [Nitrospirae bacterium]|nr:hypothetical protein [Nitrospirota bacterium]
MPAHGRLWFTLILFAVLRCFLVSDAYAEGGGYTGMSLPSGFVAFSGTSPWNTPVSNTPAIDPNSGVMIEKLKQKAGALHSNILKWTIPLFVIDSQKSPKVDVRTLSE